VETAELTKTYRSHGITITALDHGKFQIRKGSVFGLLGHNGAGKTTLIMILMGLTLPTSGTAKVLGHDVVKESLKIRRKVGFMPEGIGFYDHLTAQQHLDYVAALNNIPQGERKGVIDEALSTTGLSEFKDRKVGVFSRGMSQRLAIAQTLLKDGELLIFDEPTAGVDPEGAREFKNLVGQLNKEGKTILISTHLLSEIGPICSDIVIIREGRIVVQGGVSEIVERTMKEEGYWIEAKFNKDAASLAPILGKLEGVSSMEVKGETVILKADTDIRSAITREATKGKVDVLSLRRLEPSLEDLFMRFYGREEEAKDIA